MSQTKTIMTSQATTGPGGWASLPPGESNRGFIVSVGEVNGTVSASVNIEVANSDIQGPATSMKFNLPAGVSTLTVPLTNIDVDANCPFPMVRANVIALTGGGKVTVTCTATHVGGE